MTQKCFFYLLFQAIFILHQANAFSIKMFPINSPDLQILPQSLTVNEQEHFLVNISLSRALYAKKQESNLALDSIQQSAIPFLRHSYFVTQLTFGNLNKSFTPYMILDTFSDLTWIQCANCNPCFKLNDTFPLDDSPSYVRMDLDDRRCVPKEIFNGSCAFNASYGKGHSEGYLGKTNFIFKYLNQGNYTTKIVPNIPLGCGIRNAGFPFSNAEDEDGYETNLIAGVIGLSPSPRSFITGSSQLTNGRFSYCMPHPNGTNTTIMSFGGDANISADNGNEIQTISMKPSARYYLYFAAIVVGGVRLKINPAIFKLDHINYKTGFFIDPGTPITVLSEPAYTLLKHELIAQFSSFGWDPITLPKDKRVYDLCYAKLPDNSTDQFYPTVAFHFVQSFGGEVELVLPPENVFEKMKRKSGFCLKMVSSSDGPSILGAFQQSNFRFLFDVDTELLSFVPENC
ncbi:hypothetical protein vseg_021402 [Gypsophila vaccaria]